MSEIAQSCYINTLYNPSSQWISLSSSFHIFHSNFSHLPSAPQHLQCSTELSAATARMPLENNSAISLLPPIQPSHTTTSCQSHWIPAKIALFMSTVRFISEKEKKPWLYVYIFVFVLVVYVMQWHLVSEIADSAVCI